MDVTKSIDPSITMPGVASNAARRKRRSAQSSAQAASATKRATAVSTGHSISDESDDDGGGGEGSGSGSRSWRHSEDGCVKLEALASADAATLAQAITAIDASIAATTNRKVKVMTNPSCSSPHTLPFILVSRTLYCLAANRRSRHWHCPPRAWLSVEDRGPCGLPASCCILGNTRSTPCHSTQATTAWGSPSTSVRAGTAAAVGTAAHCSSCHGWQRVCAGTHLPR